MTPEQKQELLAISLLMKKARLQEEAEKKAERVPLSEISEKVKTRPFADPLSPGKSGGGMLSDWVEPLEPGQRPYDSVTGEQMDDRTYAEYLESRKQQR